MIEKQYVPIKKNRRAVLAGGLALLGIGFSGVLGGVSAAQVPPAPSTATEVVLGVGSYADVTSDTVVQAERVVLPSGGRVRVRNGAHLTVVARTVVIQGPFTFDGRGDPGSPGGGAGEWTSSGACSIGLFGPGEVAHNDWEASGGHSNDRGGNGQPGGNGAVIDVRYVSTVQTGVVGDWRSQVTFLTGGGAGGPEGQGRRLICGCHSSHVKHGPSGSPGAPGTDGRYTLQQVPSH
jgi:hypothetical protein